jgi:hypothetical protein
MTRLISGWVLLGLAAVTAAAFYDRYWRWRGCFNELGRCYDPDSGMVLVEQAGAIWGGATVLCLASGLFLIVRSRSRR